MNANPIQQKPKYHFKTLNDAAKHIPKTKCLNNWNKYIEDFYIRLTKFEPPYLTPKYTNEIDESLAYTVRGFDWFLPEDHWLYKDYKRSLQNVTLVSLLTEIENLHVCGATNDQFNEGERSYLSCFKKRKCHSSR